MRQRIGQFVSRATTLLAEQGLQDHNLDSCIAWLTAIASSSLPVYRTTATVAALQMSLAFATSAAADASALVIARRQSSATKRRSGAQETPGNKRDFERLTARIARIDELLSALFDGYGACARAWCVCAHAPHACRVRLRTQCDCSPVPRREQRHST
jgi:hypothetical protein